MEGRELTFPFLQRPFCCMSQSLKDFLDFADECESVDSSVNEAASFQDTKSEWTVKRCLSGTSPPASPV